MARIAIVRPIAPVAISAGRERLLTPNPKEAYTSAAIGIGSGTNVGLDMGAAVSLDSFFLGFTDVPASTTLTVHTIAAMGGAVTALVADRPIAHSNLFSPRRHALAIAPAPVAARYWRLSLYNNTGAAIPAGFTMGVLAVGKAFSPTWGHEWGAGRPYEDTGSAERLFGGGFGINDGVLASGYQWTFGDLSDAEREQLHAIVMDRRGTRSALVVEDPDPTDGLNERIHWGLFDRLEPFERVQAGLTRWNLKIRDWA